MDLAGIVTNLSRVRAGNRARLANSDLTRAFLAAGLSLTDEALARPDGEGGPGILSFVSRPRVVELARRQAPELVPTEAKFRDRWAGQHDFLEDFVAYALAVRAEALSAAIGRWAEALATAEGPFSATVRRVAGEAARLLAELPGYRVQLLCAVTAGSDAGVARALAGFDASVAEAWLALVEKVLAARGATLRPGLTPRRVAALLEGAAGGAAPGGLAGIGAEAADDGAGPGAALAAALLGLLLSAADDGTGMTLDEAADRRFGRA